MSYRLNISTQNYKSNQGAFTSLGQIVFTHNVNEAKFERSKRISLLYFKNLYLPWLKAISEFENTTLIKFETYFCEVFVLDLLETTHPLLIRQKKFEIFFDAVRSADQIFGGLKPSSRELSTIFYPKTLESGALTENISHTIRLKDLRVDE
jgi:hypothetical protein